VNDGKTKGCCPRSHASPFATCAGEELPPAPGKTLYQHILDTLLHVPEVDQIVVDTDSPEILAGLAQHYPQVVRIERPEALRADSISMNEILIYDTAQVRADLYLQTHSTNPLLKASTISNAIHTFLSAYPAKDSLFSVTRLQTRLYDHTGKALNHDPRVLIQTQDLPPYMKKTPAFTFFLQPRWQKEAPASEKNQSCLKPIRKNPWILTRRLI